MAYFANGSEGSVLGEQCSDCPLGYGWNDPRQQRLFDGNPIPKPCPVAFVQMNWNYDQNDKGNGDLKDAMNLLIDGRGECQVRKLLLVCREEKQNV